MNTNDNAHKEIIVEITQADYDEGLAKGWTDDDMLKPGTYKVRRATRFRAKDQRETVTINLDADVLDFLRQRSDEPYEQQINTELRRLMQNEKLEAA